MPIVSRRSDMKQNFGDIEVAKDGSDRVLVSSAIRYYFWFGFKYVHIVYRDLFSWDIHQI